MLQLSDSLPDPAALVTEPARDLSVAAPGWYTFDLQYRNFGGAEQGVSEDLPAIDIAGSGSSGFCIFGAQGFDGDSYPTGIRADVSDVVGEYYLLHTNYVDGRWMTAGPFTESVTYEYPEVSEYSGPEILASKYTNHFVAILVPDGSSLQLDMLQLGVDGGSEGPFPVLAVNHKSNEDIVTIVWYHSPDYNEPDFAGYSVERSDFPVGEFSTISSENIFESHYNDDTAVDGKTYMYRMRTWDTAGNSALSMAIPAWRAMGITDGLVCEVDMPRGPLVGPVEVTFDMSGSFDNDGDPINDYYFNFGPGLGEINQANPVLTVTLQPGCYLMRFTVKIGGDTDSRIRMLKVYPEWETDSQLIDDGTPIFLRYSLSRSFYDPDSEKVVFLFSDVSTPSLVSITVDKDGNVDRKDVPHLFPEPLVLMSEPVYVDGTWQFGAAYGFGFMICSWHDNEIVPNYLVTNNTDTAYTSMVTDGQGSVWLLYQEINVGYDLKIINLDTLAEVTLVPNALAGTFFDAEWNEAEEAIDLVYSGNGSTEWMRWSPVIGPMGSFSISAADSGFVDVENNPDTGRPTALITDGPNIRFSELNPDNMTWTAPLPVDPIDPDWTFSKLLYRDGNAYCYLGQNPGGSTLYRRNGANWDVINDADFADGGYYNSMAFNPTVPGFYVLDSALDYKTRLTLMQENGDEQELWASDGWSRYGLELSAASSNTEIHLMHKPIDRYVHWTSPDGDTWTETSDAGIGEGGKIVSDGNGEIYSSLKDGATAFLRHWVDPAWVVIENNPISADTVPIIYGQHNELMFGNFDGNMVPDEFHWKENLAVPVVFNTPTTEIADGAFAGVDVSSMKLLVLYGSPDPNNCDLGLMNKVGELDYLCDPSYAAYDDDWTRGKHIEGAVYYNRYTGPREVFYVAYGPNAGFSRIVRNPFSEWDVDTFGFPTSEIEVVLNKRSLSATTAWGGTSVAIGARMLKGIEFFEWSNFGEWEQLPLPQGMHDDSLHELVVGPDGRWHIIYRDYVNDDLRIISTVE
ncbi:hypothetical protein KDL29_02675 [bacterium]|nr:hypothetical protein [bacterium]